MPNSTTVLLNVGAAAFDLLDFITWRVSLLPCATTSATQMACRSCCGGCREGRGEDVVCTLDAGEEP